MVATRGQTGSDGPATSTPSSVAPGRHPAVSTPTPGDGANGGAETTQAGGCSKATQVDPAKRSRVPWLPTDEETGTEPEDLYSQGDRIDSWKDRWERAVGGAVSGIGRLLPPERSVEPRPRVLRRGDEWSIPTVPLWRDKTTSTWTSCWTSRSQCYYNPCPVQRDGRVLRARGRVLQFPGQVVHTISDKPAYVRCGVGQSTIQTSDCHRNECCNRLTTGRR